MTIWWDVSVAKKAFTTVNECWPAVILSIVTLFLLVFCFFFLLVFPFLSASLLKNTAFLVFALFDSLFSFNLGCKSQRQVQWPLGAFQHKLKLFDIQNCAIRNNMTFSKLSAIWELSFILRYDKCSISIKGGVSLV